MLHNKFSAGVSIKKNRENWKILKELQPWLCSRPAPSVARLPGFPRRKEVCLKIGNTLKLFFKKPVTLLI